MILTMILTKIGVRNGGSASNSMWQAKIVRIVVSDQPRLKVCKTPSETMTGHACHFSYMEKHK
jgi:hypothetical protein